MGAYYLFISYFTFVVGVSSLELAVPFSRKFLRCKSGRKQRLLFSGFLTNLIAVTAALAIPTGVLVAGWAGVPMALIPLFCLSLATEACVNEVGRFFWNIGEWKMPSLRDLIRAVIFTTAIVVSVYIENEVLTSMTFLILSAGNLAIMGYEWRSWGGARTARDIQVLPSPQVYVVKSAAVPGEVDASISANATPGVATIARANSNRENSRISNAGCILFSYICDAVCSKFAIGTFSGKSEATYTWCTFCFGTH